MDKLLSQLQEAYNEMEARNFIESNLVLDEAFGLDLLKSIWEKMKQLYQKGKPDLDVPINNSSVLQKVNYKFKEKLLNVVFKNGSVYNYQNVDPQKLARLLAADSKGSYFYHNVRDAYPYQKIS
jgi:hypothetical protein